MRLLHSQQHLSKLRATIGRLISYLCLPMLVACGTKVLPTNKNPQSPSSAVNYKSPYFKDISGEVPATIRAQVLKIFSQLKTNDPAASATCREIKVLEGESLSNAINTAMNLHGPGTYCAFPGLIDSIVRIGEGFVLILRPGEYPQTAPIELFSDRGGKALLGESAATTALVFKDGANGPNISLAAGAQYYSISGLTLTRKTPNTAASSRAISTDFTNSIGRFENLLITNQNDGLYLRANGYGWVRNVAILDSQRHGLVCSNAGNTGSSGAAPCQYLLRDVFVARSHGTGILFDPADGPMATENMDGVTTFRNAGGGLKFSYGGGIKIAYALRVDKLYSSFDGAPGLASIEIQAGYGHTISNTVVENAGGIGIRLGAAVEAVSLRNFIVRGSKGVGIETSAIQAQLAAATIYENRDAGLDALAGSPSLLNVSFQNGSGTQPLGVRSLVPSVRLVGSTATASTLYSGPTLSEAPSSGVGGAGHEAMPVSDEPTQLASSGPCIALSVASQGSVTDALYEAISLRGSGRFCVDRGIIDRPMHLPAGTQIIIGAGTIAQQAPIYLDGNGSGIIGVNPISSKLLYASGFTGPHIIASAGVFSYIVKGISLSRQDPATPGDNGIIAAAGAQNGILDNLTVEKQYDGLLLGTTAQGWVRNIFVQNNARNGIVVTGSGSARYVLRDILADSNVGWGLHLYPDGGDLEVGPVEVFLSFRNKAGGLIAAASGAAVVKGVNVANSFFGNDATSSVGVGSELRIDGGSNHQIRDTFVELTGRNEIDNTVTQPNPSVLIGSRVGTISIKGLYSSLASNHGLISEAANLSIQNSSFAANEGAGIHVALGSANIYGVNFYNNNPAAQQQYGILQTGISTVNQMATHTDGLRGSVLFSRQ